MHPLSEFELIATRSGSPSAIHRPTGIHLHSAVDPISEAREIARALDDGDAEQTVILGSGLGYLPEALAELRGPNHLVVVIEPDSALVQLARFSRSGAPCFVSGNIRVISVATGSSLLRHCRECPDHASFIVSPYLLRLSEREDHPVAGLLRILRTEVASSPVYAALLLRHGAQNAAILRKLPSALDVRLPVEQRICVAGAGPSLDFCLGYLRAQRPELTLVATTGALPSLLAAGLTPDWVVALEGRAAVLDDLRDAPPGLNVIVFPATHPELLRRTNLAFYAGGCEGNPSLEVRGGSSAVPALDFALRASTADVALLGLDLGYQIGQYAASARRDQVVEAVASTVPPKFLSMRAGLERVVALHASPGRRIYHVLTAGRPLRGTTLLSPHLLMVARPLALPREN